MSRTPDSADPFPRTSRDWRAMFFKLAKALLATVATAVVAIVGYAANNYIRDIAKTEATNATTPFVELPPKVQSLTEFKTRAEEAHKETAEQLQLLRVRLERMESAGDARWIAQADQNRRVLELLDRMDRRAARAASQPSTVPAVTPSVSP